MNAGKAVLLLPLLFSSAAWCDERVDHIRAAAAAVRGLDAAEARETVFRCYEKHLFYQTCVAQDFIVSNVAARDARDPLGVLEEMADRITETMARNQVPLADAQQFILLVKEHGFQ
jgi:hypothetical protein